MTQNQNKTGDKPLGMSKLLEFTIVLLLVLIIVLCGYHAYLFMAILIICEIFSVLGYIREFRAVYQINHRHLKKE